LLEGSFSMPEKTLDGAARSLLALGVELGKESPNWVCRSARHGNYSDTHHFPMVP